MTKMEYSVKNAILLIGFNRPDNMKKILEVVGRVKPRKLYVALDGPRQGRDDDYVNCNKVKQLFDDISWECEVKMNISDINLGCSKRPHTAISWALSLEEQVIILEDDCLPEIAFFEYCDELLDKYKNDTRVMLVCGTNSFGTWETEYSYLFSKHTRIWGWATWRRAWEQFDVNIKLWGNSEIKKLLSQHFTAKEYKEEIKYYDELINAEDTTTAWDYQWGFNVMVNNGLAIIPQKNLIKNIGFGEDATHTTDIFSKFAAMNTYDLNIPLKHPPFVMPDYVYDKRFAKETHKRNIFYMIYLHVRHVVLWCLHKFRYIKQD